MDKINKTICLVIHSLQAGGMERVMSELANHFAKNNVIKLHLILYGIKRDIFYPLPENIILHKPNFQFNDSHRIQSTIKTMIYLRRTIKEIRPDAVLSFGEYWNSFVLMATLGLRCKIFVSDRCQPDKYLGRTQEYLRKWLYLKAVGIIAQTEIAKLIYQKNIAHPNICVIGNPIRNIGPDISIKKENIVLSVGRLIKSKHHDELIKLFVKINMTGWKLVIVGDDALKQNNMLRLRNLITDLNASDQIILAGKQNDIESYYQRSKIFAFTSSSEGFPNVIGEAQSAGLPVIAFDCVAGPSDMITDGKNGILIPLFDYELFQHKLTELMTNEHLQSEMGLAGNKTIQKYSVSTIGFSFEQFILSKIR